MTAVKLELASMVLLGSYLRVESLAGEFGLEREFWYELLDRSLRAGEGRFVALGPKSEALLALRTGIREGARWEDSIGLESMSVSSLLDRPWLEPVIWLVIYRQLREATYFCGNVQEKQCVGG